MKIDLKITHGTQVLVDGDVMKGTRTRQATASAWLRGTARVTAHYLQRVLVWDRAHLVAICCQDVRTIHNARVEARGFTIVYAFERSKIVAKDHAIVFAYDEAEVTAHDRALVIFEGPVHRSRPNRATVRIAGPRVVVVDRRTRANLLVSVPGPVPPRVRPPRASAAAA